MKLILVRHAIAEDRDAFAQTGAPDEERPLTKDGRKRMRRAARGLRELVEDLDMIITSPLVRAVETADIIADEYNFLESLTLPLLAPDTNFDPILEWFRRLDNVQSLVAVGHEPNISSLAAWLLTGNHRPLFEFKKGSAAMLEFDREITEGHAQLRWFLTPAQLRFIGD